MLLEIIRNQTRVTPNILNLRVRPLTVSITPIKGSHRLLKVPHRTFEVIRCHTDLLEGGQLTEQTIAKAGRVTVKLRQQFRRYYGVRPADAVTSRQQIDVGMQTGPGNNYGRDNSFT